MFTSLLEALIEWASSAWNWLQRFFTRLWGFLVSWWGKLKEFVNEALKEFREIVILDQRHKNGRSLVEAIRKAQPNTVSIDDIENGLVSVSIDGNGDIKKVESLQATVQEEDQYDKAAEACGGVLRIK